MNSEIERSEVRNSPPIFLSIIWNHHQPAYKDTNTDKYKLPWVRLHGVKSYYPMAAFIERFTRVRNVFNISPSLTRQINDFEDGHEDYYSDLSRKPSESLSPQEIEFIRENFFTNPRMAKEGNQPAFRRLCELEKKKNQNLPFSHQDLTDLQLLHNLAWINPLIRDEEPILKALILKSGGFSRQDINFVLNFHYSVVKKIIPAYRKILEESQGELMATPFFHPILPLVINTDSALRSSPSISMPEHPFACPDDAGYQIEKALDFNEKVFKTRPVGLWPPEMAVSSEIIPVLARKGIRWTVTDEIILERTLKLSLRGPALKSSQKDSAISFETGNISDNLLHPSILYRPYRIKSDGSQLTVFFRDRFLSDLISFHYKTIEGASAAEDLLSRLYRIKTDLEGRRGPHIVTLALDGENCWEHYKEDSYGFLKALYESADKLDWLEMTTPKQFLQRFPVVHNLPDLATGSWNFGNLENWIGTPRKNKVWDTLYKVRKDLITAAGETSDREKLQKAWDEFCKAQGSDFSKWPDSTSPETAGIFDELFRLHLKNVYIILGKTPPDYLM